MSERTAERPYRSEKGRFTILAADDDPVCLADIVALLKSDGMLVQVTERGDQALALIAAQRPDLVLLGVHLPVLDGFEVCRRMKQGEKTRDIPVVFLNDDYGEAWAEGLKQGAADFVSKPIRREELLARVATHLELCQLRKDLGRQVANGIAQLGSINSILKGGPPAPETDCDADGILRKLTAEVPIGIWVLDAHQRLLFHNKRHTGSVRGEAGRCAFLEWVEAVHPSDVVAVQRKYTLAVEEHRGFRIECRTRGANGTVRWVLHTGIPRFAGGAFMGHIGTTIDITNLKRSQQRMIAAEKLESLGFLTAGIAHDFNNLVASILTSCDMALTDLPPDSPVRASIERIDAAAGRASEIVSLLMSYAGWNGGRVDRLHLSQVVSEMVALLKHAVPPKAVVSVNLDYDLPEIHANVTQVRQVILNLMMNAFEALGSEGMVTIATDQVSFKRRQCALELADG